MPPVETETGRIWNPLDSALDIPRPQVINNNNYTNNNSMLILIISHFDNNKHKSVFSLLLFLLNVDLMPDLKVKQETHSLNNNIVIWVQTFSSGTSKNPNNFTSVNNPSNPFFSATLNNHEGE